MLKRTPVGQTKTKVTFALPIDQPGGEVSVVGDFNGWEPGRHTLVPRRNGIRSVSLTLPTGRHRFRYLASDGIWVDDHEADAVDDQGSIVEL